MRRLSAAVLLLTIAGCRPEGGAGHVSFATSNGLVELDFPRGWYQNREKNPYDLQCFARDQRMTSGVFFFAQADLAENVTPKDILQMQVEDMRAKRQKFELVEEQRSLSVGKNALVTVVYSGEKEASRYYYSFTLVQFTERPEMFLVVLQVAFPSKWSEQKPILEQIAASARPRSATPTK
jgi:hypothetical protein